MHVPQAVFMHTVKQNKEHLGHTSKGRVLLTFKGVNQCLHHLCTKVYFLAIHVELLDLDDLSTSHVNWLITEEKLENPTYEVTSAISAALKK